MIYRFGAYELDTELHAMRCGDTLAPLRPKVFQVLHYLLEARDRVVSKDELYEAVWQQKFLSDNAVDSVMRAVRQAIGDSGREQRIIQTLPGRGYRFIAPVEIISPLSSRSGLLEPAIPVTSSDDALVRLPEHLVVGRQEVVAAVYYAFDHAIAGTRQFHLLSGQAGIGKTTVVELAMDQFASRGDVRVVQGQCIDHEGEGKAYLPLLEALERLCLAQDGAQMLSLMRQYAPMWLAQLPALVEMSELNTLRQQTQGATQVQMVRELVDVFERLTVEHPLVLVLEDLHWIDMMTLDWLTYMVRRPEPARLLLLGTYRPTEVAEGHRLRRIIQELSGHGYCTESVLEPLCLEEVTTYVRWRLQSESVPVNLASKIFQHTEGHPLFMVHVLDHLLDIGLVVHQDGCWSWQDEAGGTRVPIPVGLEPMLTAQIEQLELEARGLLEAASIAGSVFTGELVAAAMQAEVEDVETSLEALARTKLFIQADGLDNWPDGTLSGRYRFQHALYQEAFYQRVGLLRRIWIHRRMGERLERGYAHRTHQCALELALHYEAGQEPARAVQYRLQAAETALSWYAYNELIEHSSAGLRLLSGIPDTPEYTQYAYKLHYFLGVGMNMTKGFDAPEVAQAFGQVRALGPQVWQEPQMFSKFVMVLITYLLRGETETARDLGEQLLTWAQRVDNTEYFILAHRALGYVMSFQGDLLQARDHLEQCIALYDDVDLISGDTPFKLDYKVHALANLAWLLWWLGFPDQALRRGQEALRLAQDQGHPFSLAHAGNYAAGVHLFRGELELAQEQAVASGHVGREYGFPVPEMRGLMLEGAVLLEQHRDIDGIARVTEASKVRGAPQNSPIKPYGLALTAMAQARLGKIDEAFGLLQQALKLTDTTGVYCWQAELLRLQGEFLLHEDGGQLMADLSPQTCFHQALALARSQQAKSWELRTSTSLSRLWQREGKYKAAYDLLAPIYQWFAEGFDTADMQEAKQLLAELSRRVPAPQAL